MLKGSQLSMRKWRVSAEEAGMRLLAFLREKNGDAPSVKSLKRAVDGKCCSVNGKTETFSSRPLREGDTVVLCLHPKEALQLVTLYEDADFLIVNKPAGLICENRHFAPFIKKRAQLIHRLDKETSGVVMLGKSPEIIEQMISLFRNKKIHKQYLALVDGCVVAQEGRIDSPLRRKATFIQGQAVYTATQGSGGMAALTLWKCLGKAENASLLLCEPITGRTHQLRVHLSLIGHPILGDLHYGKRFRSVLRPKRHLLHAYRIAFIHPKTQLSLEVVAPLPTDFKDALQQLKLKFSEERGS